MSYCKLKAPTIFFPTQSLTLKRCNSKFNLWTKTWRLLKGNVFLHVLLVWCYLLKTNWGFWAALYGWFTESYIYKRLPDSDSATKGRLGSYHTPLFWNKLSTPSTHVTSWVFYFIDTKSSEYILLEPLCARLNVWFFLSFWQQNLTVWK